MFCSVKQMKKMSFNYTILILLFGVIKAASSDTVYTKVVQLKGGQIRGSVIDTSHGERVEFYEAIKFGKFGKLFEITNVILFLFYF